MIVLYILTGILLLLCLLSLVRVGGWVEYSQTGFLAKVKVGPFYIQVFPQKPKPNKKEKSGKKADASPKFGGSFDQLKELLPVVADAAGQLKRKVLIRELQMDLIWSDPDPARCAIGFGAANALIGMIWPPIEQNFRVKDYRIRTDVDFNSGKPTVYLLATVTLTVGQVISLVLRFGTQFLKVYRQMKPETMDLKKRQTITQEKEAV